jgi:hypothetical protein
MGDPTKDFYQARLQAAWGQLSAAVGYPPHQGLDATAHSQVNGFFRLFGWGANPESFT